MRNQAVNTKDDSVVVSGTNGKKGASRRTVGVLLAVVVGVLALGAATYLLNTRKQSSEHTAKLPVLVKYKDGGQIDPDQAIKDVNGTNMSALTKTQRAELYIVQAQAYSTKQDYPNLLATYQKMLENDPNNKNLYESIADTAMLTGNYPLAVTYYQKAIDWTQTLPKDKGSMVKDGLTSLQARLEDAKRHVQ